MVTLSRLFIHPVKSMRGMGLTHAFADISGRPSIACLWSPKPTDLYYRSPVSANGEIYSGAAAMAFT